MPRLLDESMREIVQLINDLEFAANAKTKAIAVPFWDEKSFHFRPLRYG
jgi:hypothetical protein